MATQDNLFDIIDKETPAVSTESADSVDNSAQNSEPSAPQQNAPQELSVSEISQKLKRTVESNFSYVRVRGELSRVTIAKSGHCYTSLKDENSVLDAICWRGTVGNLSITPEEGLDVVVTGRLTTYPGRSNYQIIIESMELAGEGALLKMLEERRKKLANEGLFDAAKKQPLPFLPKVIGVVTSPTGAVIRDIMHRLNDRFPRHVLLYPAIVQGERAAEEVTKGIEQFNAMPDTHALKPDVLIVGRGGGSLEDLMPFNDERVVRAIATSQIPIISAVGHETDTTLADYAADLRAPTPTGAAEKAVPVRTELMNDLEQLTLRLHQSMRRRIKDYKTQIQHLARGLPHPKQNLEYRMQRLDNLSQSLDHSLLRFASQKKHKLLELTSKLSPIPYQQRLKSESDKVTHLALRMQRAVQAHHDKKAQSLSTLDSLLNTLSFKKTLARGFAIVRSEDGNVISSTQEISTDTTLKITVQDGDIAVKTC